jgi:putative DNA primase/helicase
MFGIDAPVAGSGKGLLVRCAHLIAYGVDVAHMSLPPDEEEMRKQITTTLLSGDPAVLLDNAGVQIGGDSLESLITAPIWKVRLLGKNEDSGALVPRIVVIVGGNGLEFVGDMGRRTLRIRIDTEHESPEERDDYKHPERAGEDKLLQWVRANRAELVVDALTILRAWHVAERPGEVKRWGSFESWASTIARCVQWVDLPDPTLGRATKDAALDPQRQALSVVYDAIRRLGTDRGVTAGDLVRVAFPPPREPPNGEDDLAEAIGALTPNSRGDASTRARLLGRKLKTGRIIDGRKLEAVPGGARSVRYAVVAVDPSTTGASA